MNINEKSTKSQLPRWLVGLSVVSAVGWLSAYSELSRMRAEVAQWRICEATLAAKDSETGLPVESSITRTPPTTRLPNQLGFQVRSEAHVRHLRWVSAEPIPVVVGAEGYEDQSVIIGSTNEDSPVIVTLKRKPK